MPTPRFNLLIVHTPEGQDISDWVKISELIRERAPDIEVRIASNRAKNSATRKWQVRRPSLVFSPYHLATFEPLGGKIYAGRQYSKLEQLRLFKAAGISTPRTVQLGSDTKIQLEEWGEYAIVKPSMDSFGRGVRLVRTADVAVRPTDFLLDRRDPVLLQQFIDTGPRPWVYRVLTLFGRPLYAVSIHADAPTPSDDLAPSGKWRAISSLGRERRFVSDGDLFDLVRSAHDSMPEVPVKGCDVVRERSSGRLYLLEANPGGNTWAFSSPAGKQVQERAGLDFYAQFDALAITADELIKRTRTEAV